MMAEVIVETERDMNADMSKMVMWKK
jgi:hypothetical protein